MEKELVLKKMNGSEKESLMRTLEIDFVDVGEDFLIARMPVTPKLHQPDGVLHGGATFALAETCTCEYTCANLIKLLLILDYF